MAFLATFLDREDSVEAKKRHAAVLLAVLVGGVATALYEPLSVDARDVLFYAILLFLVYLAGSALWTVFFKTTSRRG